MSTMRLLLDMDDPCLDQYREEIRGRVSVVISQRTTVTALLNENWRYAADCFKFFSVTNDDFVYRTEGWDVKMTHSINWWGNGTGISYANDLLQGVHMPTTSIVSRDIVQALGWLQMPRLIHLFGDNVWKHIGQRCDCLWYHPEVTIEHRHFFARKAVEDEIYKRTNSKAMYDDDKANYIKWLYGEAPGDIDKVKRLVAVKQQFLSARLPKTDKINP